MKKIMIVILICAAVVLGINFYVIAAGAGSIACTFSSETMDISSDEAAQLKSADADCIIVPGAQVIGDKPSPVLKDRLDAAVELYKKGFAPRILLSGDHGQVEYDELRAMSDYVTDAGVPGKDIFLDHAGFSTYETMYRARDVFCVKKAIIVTQKYHLYRALYIGKCLGLKVCGAASDQRKHSGQIMRSAREVAARDKDFFQCIIKPEPTYLGNKIPISGSGVSTHEE